MPEVQATETVGLSPKAGAAGAAALIAPLVVRLAADLFNIEVESTVVETLILAVVAAGSAIFAAYKARPGTVKVAATTTGARPAKV